MSATGYLDQLLDPVTEILTPEVARKIVELKAGPVLETHIEVLRSKANEGTLSLEEDLEYKEFVEAVDVISIIQAKARRCLETKEN
jgi:hypothetical protein